MTSWLRKFYIPVLVQITVPYLLLALAVSAGATYITSRLIVESVEERFANQLIASAVQVQESMVRKEEELLADVRLLSNIQGVAQAVEAEDAQALARLLLPVALNDGVEYLAVLSPGLEVVLSAQLGAGGYAAVATPPQLLSQPMVANVLAGLVDQNGDKFTGVVEYENGPVLMLSGPILQAGPGGRGDAGGAFAGWAGGHAARGKPGPSELLCRGWPALGLYSDGAPPSDQCPG